MLRERQESDISSVSPLAVDDFKSAEKSTGEGERDTGHYR